MKKIIRSIMIMTVMMIGLAMPVFAASGGVEASTTVPAHDLVLRPVVRPIGYSISYDLDGGTVATANPTSYNIESGDITLNNPTKEGYEFTGWTGSNGYSPSKSVTIQSGKTGNLSFTANWKLANYVITWDEPLARKKYYLGTLGTYLGDAETIVGSEDNAGSKRIIYTNTNGNTAYANPYEAGSITIKPGTAVKLQMVSGFGKGDDLSTESSLGWNIKGSGYCDIQTGGNYAVLTSEYTPTFSSDKWDYTDYRGDADGTCYGWTVIVE